MKYFKLLILNFALLPTLSVASVACENSNFTLLYRANTQESLFLYWEKSSSSPSSEAMLERRNAYGDAVWSAQAFRSCSQGVSRCYLTIPYALDGYPFDKIRVEMNAFDLDGMGLLVFSHLDEIITQTYFKDFPSRDFSLIGPSGTIDLTYKGRDFQVPNLFQETCRK